MSEKTIAVVASEGKLDGEHVSNVLDMFKQAEEQTVDWPEIVENEGVDVSPFDADLDIEYPVMEIFESIQGEGSMLGMPVTFIRLQGCNMHCSWCDTKDSWKQPEEDCDGEHYKWMKAAEIANQSNKSIVVITGGEPCQYDLAPLIYALHLKQAFVCLETNGTLPTPEEIDWVVTSPKAPEYRLHGECFFNELKYVVDEEFSFDCIPDDLKKVCGAVWLQPCEYVGDEEKTKESAAKCVRMALEVPYLRVGIQLHKVLDIK